MIDLYPLTPNKELVDIFHVTYDALTTRARDLHLKKEALYKRSFLGEIGKRNGKTGRKHRFNENYFKTLTPESAYWLGFIQADGCIIDNYNNKRLQILLGEKDAYMVECFRQDIDAFTVPIAHDVKRRRVYIRFNSDEMVYDLEKQGIYPNKIKIGTFPMFDDPTLLNHYLRGVFDGDGHIGESKGVYSMQPQFNICGCKEFCEWTLEQFRFYAGVPGGGVYRNTSIYSLIISGRNQVGQCYQYLYKDATRWLSRKKEVFRKILRLE